MYVRKITMDDDFHDTCDNLFIRGVFVRRLRRGGHVRLHTTIRDGTSEERSDGFTKTLQFVGTKPKTANSGTFSTLRGLVSRSSSVPPD